MQRRVRKKGYAFAAFRQGVINGDEPDQYKEEDLHDLANLDAARAKESNLPAKQFHVAPPE
jgi:hypothetical protein